MGTAPPHSVRNGQCGCNHCWGRLVCSAPEPSVGLRGHRGASDPLRQSGHGPSHSRARACVPLLDPESAWTRRHPAPCARAGVVRTPPKKPSNDTRRIPHRLRETCRGGTPARGGNCHAPHPENPAGANVSLLEMRLRQALRVLGGGYGRDASASVENVLAPWKAQIEAWEAAGPGTFHFRVTLDSGGGVHVRGLDGACHSACPERHDPGSHGPRRFHATGGPRA